MMNSAGIRTVVRERVNVPCDAPLATTSIISYSNPDTVDLELSVTIGGVSLGRRLCISKVQVLLSQQNASELASIDSTLLA